jgi:hypothetical protein
VVDNRLPKQQNIPKGRLGVSQVSASISPSGS